MINHNGKEYKNVCFYEYNWISLLYGRDGHNIVNQLYFLKNPLEEYIYKLYRPYQNIPSYSLFFIDNELSNHIFVFQEGGKF